MTSDQSVISIQLSVCEDEMEKLNDWERSFIENISDQFTRTGELTENQMNKLKQIYDKVV